MGSSAKVTFASERVSPNLTTYVAKMHTLFEIPVTLYYYKPEQVYLEKSLKIKVYGYKQGDRSLAGECRIDISKLVGNSKGRFDPMLELLDEDGKPCGIFLAIELALTMPKERSRSSDQESGVAGSGLNQTPSLSASPSRNAKPVSPGNGSSETLRKTITFAPVPNTVSDLNFVFNSSHNTCLIISH